VSAAAASAVDRLKSQARATTRAALDPVVALLARLGVRPDHVTWTGLLVTMVGGGLFAAGRFRAGALVALAGCIMDSLDGALARRGGGESRWGAFLDSTTDRVADAALFLGVAAFYARAALATLRNEDRLTDLLMGPPVATAMVVDDVMNQMIYALLALLAMVAALLVSYTRARMEGLGLECRAGWFERPERLVVLLGAALFGAASPVMPWALAALVMLSFFTVFQRVAYARARLQGPARGGADGPKGGSRE
jgi:CDP-diacylglycerol--glycerol-3-phosphate 3-phosphatidyltransferase